jgi:NitT/TauT family transport system substrate-binding protein
MANPEAAIKAIKERDGLIDEKLELRRLKLAIADAVATPNARAEGFGQVSPSRLALMARKSRTPTAPRPASIPKGLECRLPAIKAELTVFPK